MVTPMGGTIGERPRGILFTSQPTAKPLRLRSCFQLFATFKMSPSREEGEVIPELQSGPAMTLCHVCPELDELD